MSKIKFVLPMLAFVLAIGMSFAFTNANEEDSSQAIIVHGVAYEANVNCGGQSENCMIQLTDENNLPIQGEIYQVLGADSQGNYTVAIKSNSADPFYVRASALQPKE